MQINQTHTRFSEEGQPLYPIRSIVCLTVFGRGPASVPDQTDRLSHCFRKRASLCTRSDRSSVSLFSECPGSANKPNTYTLFGRGPASVPDQTDRLSHCFRKRASLCTRSDRSSVSLFSEEGQPLYPIRSIVCLTVFGRGPASVPDQIDRLSHCFRKRASLCTRSDRSSVSLFSEEGQPLYPIRSIVCLTVFGRGPASVPDQIDRLSHCFRKRASLCTRSDRSSVSLFSEEGQPLYPIRPIVCLTVFGRGPASVPDQIDRLSHCFRKRASLCTRSDRSSVSLFSEEGQPLYPIRPIVCLTVFGRGPASVPDQIDRLSHCFRKRASLCTRSDRSSVSLFSEEGQPLYPIRPIVCLTVFGRGPASVPDQIDRLSHCFRKRASLCTRSDRSSVSLFSEEGQPLYPIRPIVCLTVFGRGPASVPDQIDRLSHCFRKRASLCTRSDRSSVSLFSEEGQPLYPIRSIVCLTVFGRGPASVPDQIDRLSHCFRKRASLCTRSDRSSVSLFSEEGQPLYPIRPIVCLTVFGRGPASVPDQIDRLSHCFRKRASLCTRSDRSSVSLFSEEGQPLYPIRPIVCLTVFGRGPASVPDQIDRLSHCFRKRASLCTRSDRSSVSLFSEEGQPLYPIRSIVCLTVFGRGPASVPDQIDRLSHCFRKRASLCTRSDRSSVSLFSEEGQPLYPIRPIVCLTVFGRGPASVPDQIDRLSHCFRKRASLCTRSDRSSVSLFSEEGQPLYPIRSIVCLTVFGRGPASVPDQTDRLSHCFRKRASLCTRSDRSSVSLFSEEGQPLYPIRPIVCLTVFGRGPASVPDQTDRLSHCFRKRASLCTRSDRSSVSLFSEEGQPLYPIRSIVCLTVFGRGPASVPDQTDRLSHCFRKRASLCTRSDRSSVSLFSEEGQPLYPIRPIVCLTVFGRGPASVPDQTDRLSHCFRKRASLCTRSDRSSVSLFSEEGQPLYPIRSIVCLTVFGRGPASVPDQIDRLSHCFRKRASLCTRSDRSSVSLFSEEGQPLYPIRPIVCLTVFGRGPASVPDQTDRLSHCFRKRASLCTRSDRSSVSLFSEEGQPLYPIRPIVCLTVFGRGPASVPDQTDRLSHCFRKRASLCTRSDRSSVSLFSEEGQPLYPIRSIVCLTVFGRGPASVPDQTDRLSHCFRKRASLCTRSDRSSVSLFSEEGQPLYPIRPIVCLTVFGRGPASVPDQTDRLSHCFRKRASLCTRSDRSSVSLFSEEGQPLYPIRPIVCLTVFGRGPASVPDQTDRLSHCFRKRASLCTRSDRSSVSLFSEEGQPLYPIRPIVCLTVFGRGPASVPDQTDRLSHCFRKRASLCTRSDRSSVSLFSEEGQPLYPIRPIVCLTVFGRGPASVPDQTDRLSHCFRKRASLCTRSDRSSVSLFSEEGQPLYPIRPIVCLTVFGRGPASVPDQTDRLSHCFRKRASLCTRSDRSSVSLFSEEGQPLYPIRPIVCLTVFGRGPASVPDQTDRLSHCFRKRASLCTRSDRSSVSLFSEEGQPLYPIRPIVCLTVFGRGPASVPDQTDRLSHCFRKRASLCTRSDRSSVSLFSEEGQPLYPIRPIVCLTVFGRGPASVPDQTDRLSHCFRKRASLCTRSDRSSVSLFSEEGQPLYPIRPIVCLTVFGRGPASVPDQTDRLSHCFRKRASLCTRSDRSSVSLFSEEGQPLYPIRPIVCLTVFGRGPASVPDQTDRLSHCFRKRASLCTRSDRSSVSLFSEEGQPLYPIRPIVCLTVFGRGPASVPDQTDRLSHCFRKRASLCTRSDRSSVSLFSEEGQPLYPIRPIVCLTVFGRGPASVPDQTDRLSHCFRKRASLCTRSDRSSVSLFSEEGQPLYPIRPIVCLTVFGRGPASVPDQTDRLSHCFRKRASLCTRSDRSSVSLFSEEGQPLYPIRPIVCLTVFGRGPASVPDQTDRLSHCFRKRASLCTRSDRSSVSLFSEEGQPLYPIRPIVCLTVFGRGPASVPDQTDRLSHCFRKRASLCTRSDRSSVSLFSEEGQPLYPIRPIVCLTVFGRGPASVPDQTDRLSHCFRKRASLCTRSDRSSVSLFSEEGQPLYPIRPIVCLTVFGRGPASVPDQTDRLSHCFRKRASLCTRSDRSSVSLFSEEGQPLYPIRPIVCLTVFGRGPASVPDQTDRLSHCFRKRASLCTRSDRSSVSLFSEEGQPLYPIVCLTVFGRGPASVPDQTDRLSHCFRKRASLCTRSDRSSVSLFSEEGQPLYPIRPIVCLTVFGRGPASVPDQTDRLSHCFRKRASLCTRSSVSLFSEEGQPLYPIRPIVCLTVFGRGPASVPDQIDRLSHCFRKRASLCTRSDRSSVSLFSEEGQPLYPIVCLTTTSSTISVTMAVNKTMTTSTTCNHHHRNYHHHHI